jgi:hypothetical protein
MIYWVVFMYTGRDPLPRYNGVQCLFISEPVHVVPHEVCETTGQYFVQGELMYSGRSNGIAPQPIDTLHIPV